MKKIGVVLSGCGYLDGAEIHESVLTLLALDKRGAEVVIGAPDVELEVVDHRTGKPTGEKRNVLTESARIARGKVVDVKQLDASAMDALILPGGFGAAKNLCTFASKGPDCTVVPAVESLIKAVHAQHKPIGFICIAPALGAKVLGSEHVKLTIGDDADTAAGMEKLGARHEKCAVRDIVVDRDHKVVSTPAYMLANWVGEAAEGIDKLVGEVLAMA